MAKILIAGLGKGMIDRNSEEMKVTFCYPKNKSEDLKKIYRKNTNIKFIEMNIL